MEKVDVLIVDDSVVYRSQIKAALEGTPWLHIQGTAANGKIALDKISQSRPQLLILDLEMPELDGLETLKELKARGLQIKTLVFSSVSKRGAEITLEALKLGAADFIAKPNTGASPGDSPQARIREILLPKVEALFRTQANRSHPLDTQVVQFKSTWQQIKPEILLIGSSTGGPTAIEALFAKMNFKLDVPILIAQHMPPVFTASFAERLGRVSGLRSFEAKDGMPVEANTIYVAPGDFHMRLVGKKAGLRIALDQGPQLHFVRPAVDPLFVSAAEIFGSDCLALVLTGMGEDGKQGAISIKKNGGAVVIQNKESCVVFGMPGAIHAVGAYDKMGNIDEIVELLRQKWQNRGCMHITKGAS